MKLCSTLVTLSLTAAVSAQAPQVQISIGVRETGFAGDPFIGIGAGGTSNGGIEWINLDGQTLTLDGTWQQFTFTMATDPVTAFAGTSANGVLEGTFGTLEHIRVLNSGGYTDGISLWLDDVDDTTTTGGAVTFGDFSGYVSGDEVMFQEPDFSGSTSGNVLAGSTAGVDNMVASRSESYRFDFQFADNMPTRWVRLTTFNVLVQPNPQIRFDDNSVVSFWMRGGECQPDLGSQGPGTPISELCGTGLNAGETSIYSVSGAPANAAGALVISTAGMPDLPFLGGNLVSGTGVAATIPIVASPGGTLSLPVNGDPRIIDLVLQTLFLDPQLPMLVAFTNAVQAQFGR